MKLITGYIEPTLTLTESVEGNGQSLYIEGIFMQAEKENRNRRVYPKSVLEKAINKYITEQVALGRAVGELGHPEGPVVNLDRVSHRIVSLVWQGNDVIGKALVLPDETMGKILRGLLKGGVKLGVSSRGTGAVERAFGQSRVKDNFIITALDVVQDPSAPAAFVNGIMEGVEWVWDNGVVSPKQIEKYKKTINGTPSKLLTEAQIHVWKDFLANL